MSQKQQRATDGYLGAQCRRCRLPITEQQATDSLAEFPWPLCANCVEVGHEKGKGNCQPKPAEPTDPRKALLRRYRDRLDVCETVKDAFAEVDSSVLDSEVTQEIHSVLVTYYESRKLEIEQGII
ncbi:MAG: hypothetical protein M0R06_06210 [Sphaerochaeta sp.]|jgi:hypothetical protein|nr:hypothetical protein [Sphaerochaeta sp.]